MIPTDSALLAPIIPTESDRYLIDNTVSFRFAEAGIPVDLTEFIGESSDTIAWNSAQRDIVVDTLRYIETVVDLTFQEVTDGTVDIAFQQVPRLDGDTVGFSEIVAPGQSLIVLPTKYIDPFVDGNDNVTVIHEIGHSLGLEHPFEGPNAFPGVDDPFDPGDFGLNTELATRMAYAPGAYAPYSGLDIRGEPASFGALDIAALQVMYGANTSFANGDDSYGISADLITIWDTGGNDRIDFSGAGDPVVIDLRTATLAVENAGGGYLSFVNGQNGTFANGGYTIAFGVEIEDARGGAGDDQITGNAAANLLSGNGGNDRIDGGDGLDTALYSGNQQNYTLTLSAQETVLTDRRAEGEGTDTLVNLEAVAFGDNTGGPFDLTKFAGTQSLSEDAMESFIELYIAYFNRAPDAVGLNFWGTAFATGTSLSEMAALFTNQPETRETYPEGLSDAAFVSAVYNNVLGREGDTEGVEFWLGVLTTGARSRDQFILSVLEGAKAPIQGGTAEQQAQQATDQAYLSNKTDIGAYFSVIKGLSDTESASNVMAVYDGSAESIANAQNAIDALYDTAIDAENGAFILQLVGVVDDPFAEAMV